MRLGRSGRLRRDGLDDTSWGQLERAIDLADRNDAEELSVCLREVSGAPGRRFGSYLTLAAGEAVGNIDILSGGGGVPVADLLSRITSEKFKAFGIFGDNDVTPVVEALVDGGVEKLNISGEKQAIVMIMMLAGVQAASSGGLSPEILRPRVASLLRGLAVRDPQRYADLVQM